MRAGKKHIVIKYYTNIPCDCCQYTRLLNDKEFCFSLIGLNSIFSTLPQSEYTWWKFWNLMKFLKILKFIKFITFFENFELKKKKLQFDWPTGNEISSLVGQRWKNNCSLFCWIYCWKVWRIPYYLIKQLLTFIFSLVMTIRTWSMID
jgi:hypothetical protein